ncbi:MAG: hypothetical protein AAFV80_18335, partial [Bacteroidota bacterium]
MKNIFTILILACILIFPALFNTGFVLENTVLPSEIIRTQYHQDLQVLDKAFSNLNDAALAGDIVQLTQAHVQARLAYKKVEYILAYLDPQGVYDHLNGPPLPSLERNAPELIIFEPSGLQTIDELVFGDDPEAELAAIQELTLALSAKFQPIKLFQLRSPLYDREVFEAMRMQLIRIFSLGLTGFDTPGSLNGIMESKVALEAMKVSFQEYEPFVKEALNPVYTAVNQAFADAIQYLETNTDFNTFDRMAFLR